MLYKSLKFLFLSIVVGVLSVPSGASPAFQPLSPTGQAGRLSGAGIVDEPLGARSSLGLTLWHMGHDAEQISRFHAFLKARNERMSSITAEEPARTSAERILIEPERLPETELNGWQRDGDYIASGAGDTGPEVRIPMRVVRAGLYRGWIRYYGWPTGSAVTSLRIYRAGRESEGPIINDEIYDRATPTEGPAWKDFMVDLLPGNYSVCLGHVIRLWQYGGGPAGYLPRKIDLLYFTDALWEQAPSDATLSAMRAGSKNNQLQIYAQQLLDPAERKHWREWQIRPISWEEAAAQPRLFDLSRAFWRQEIDRIAADDYGDKIPDYRSPERQVVFDDVWNLCANPVQIKRRVETLRKDLTTASLRYVFYWLRAGDFQEIEGGWQKEGTGLVGPYGDFDGVASTKVAVGRPGTYAVWVHHGGLKDTYAPWRLNVSTSDGEQLVFDRVAKNYDSDWSRIGVLRVNGQGLVNISLRPLPFTSPGTYRRIRDVLLTSDLTYVPRGEERPALALPQYMARARASGATAKDAYLIWAFRDAFTPLAQEVWDDNSWPPAGGGAIPAAPSLRPKIELTANARRAVQLGLRSLVDKPVTLQVSCGALRGSRGNFPGRLTWRVVAFVPASESSRDWSPFLLLRRTVVTIPPHNVAGVWLTVNSLGVPPGHYTSEVTFRSEHSTFRKVILQVTIKPSAVPARPVLIGGYTLPPEGEAYTRDYVRHGMNIWYGEMSKAEMQRRGIRLLIARVSEPNEAAIRSQIERFKSLGLSHSDWLFCVRDEPNGTTEEELKPFTDVAKAIRKVDPAARISFNPGEAATLATFQILDPFCDVWLPYAVHLVYPPQQVHAKRAIFTAKPWLWYTTPDLYDKSPGYPQDIYKQIVSAPGQEGKNIGTAFFAFYYPFRDAWDAGHEYLPDAGVTVLPSRHGPVATRAWEAIGEAAHTANRARAERESVDAKARTAQRVPMTGKSLQKR